LVLGLFLIALIAGMVSAAENDLENMTESERVNLAYNCLENEINKTGCERLSLEEQIFSLLAMGKCYEEVMEEARLEECWPKTGCNVKTTSMAILALDNFKKDTEKAQNWLNSQNKTPENIIWYLQIEAPEETNCTLKDSQEEEYKIKISSEEKIKENEGPSNCFSVDNDYRIKINKNCYNKDLKISCDSSFKFSLLFKKEGSSRLFISDTTKAGSKDEEVNLRINSLCFSKGTLCEYEENLWANLALDVTENKISSYLPYLISLKEDNKKYLPESFLYFLTKDNDYYTELISKQNSEGYWKLNENKYYDTSIALFPLVNDENLEEKEKAKQWLLNEQGDSGCWEGWDIEKTAFILFSVWPKYPFEKTSEIKIPETTENESSEDSSEEKLICETNGGFCMSNSECESSGGEILNEYLCKGWDSCCSKESNQEQEDNTKDKQETKIPEEKSECEEKGYSCEISCDEGYTETKIYECSSSNFKCCKPQESLPEPESKSYWWIWVLLLLIILVILGILFKDKLKEFLIKIKSKKGSNKGESSPSRRPPHIPPRGPPSSPSRNIRRPIPQRMSTPNQNIRKPSRLPIRKPLPNSKNKELDDVLKKLKEMGN